MKAKQNYLESKDLINLFAYFITKENPGPEFCAGLWFYIVKALYKKHPRILAITPADLLTPKQAPDDIKRELISEKQKSVSRFYKEYED